MFVLEDKINKLYSFFVKKSKNRFRSDSGENSLFPLIKIKKIFNSFLIFKKRLGNMSPNVPEYAMFDSGIICPKGDRWQIWV